MKFLKPLLFGLLLSGCATTSAPPLLTFVGQVKKPFLYCAPTPGGPMYLLGTNHAFPAAVLPAFVEDTLLSTRAFFVEQSRSAAEIDRGRDWLNYHDDTEAPLSKRLSPEAFKILKKSVAKLLRPEQLDSLSPLGALRALDQAQGVSGAVRLQVLGIRGENAAMDRTLEEHAAARNLSIMTLDQPGSLTAFRDLFTAPQLEERLKKGPPSEAQSEKALGFLKGVLDAYHDGDEARLQTSLVQGLEAQAQYEKAMLFERNAQWVKVLEPFLKQSSFAVVVGAAHLLGPRGLIQELEKRGLKFHRLAAEADLKSCLQP